MAQLALIYTDLVIRFFFAFIVLLPQLLKLGTLSQQIIQSSRSDDLTMAENVDSMEQWQKVKAVDRRNDSLFSKLSEDVPVDFHLGCRIQTARRFIQKHNVFVMTRQQPACECQTLLLTAAEIYSFFFD